MKTNTFTHPTAETVAEFDAVFKEMANLGKCDGFGGAEYNRKKSEWIVAGANPERIMEFVTG